MPYITSVERLGIKKGEKRGKQDDLLLLLEKKFGTLDDAVKERVRRIESPKKLESLLLAVLDAQTLDDLPFA